MSVILFILITAPGILAAKRYETLAGSYPSVRELFYSVAAFLCGILLINLLLLHLRGWDTYTFDTLSVRFIEKYLIVSLVLAAVLPWLAYLAVQDRAKPEISSGGGG